MLDKNKSIKVITNIRKNSGPRHTYIFKCSEKNCIEFISVRADALKTSSGKCKVHSHRKKPFLSIFNSILRDPRKMHNTLTYEEFIEFTKINKCYYCNGKIYWSEYGTIKGEYMTRSYFLDRKDNDIGYIKENLVVCCPRCNNFKGSISHNEFIILCNMISETFKNKIYESIK